jgi:hypothetical protein
MLNALFTEDQVADETMVCCNALDLLLMLRRGNCTCCCHSWIASVQALPYFNGKPPRSVQKKAPALLQQSCRKAVGAPRLTLYVAPSWRVQAHAILP